MGLARSSTARRQYGGDSRRLILLIPIVPRAHSGWALLVPLVIAGLCLVAWANGLHDRGVAWGLLEHLLGDRPGRRPRRRAGPGCRRACARRDRRSCSRSG